MDTFLCNNGVCDVPAMGDAGEIDGINTTEGYLMTGDVPTF